MKLTLIAMAMLISKQIFYVLVHARIQLNLDLS